MSVTGVEGVTGAEGTVEGPASSVKRTFDGVACLFVKVFPHRIETSLGRSENYQKFV